MSPFFFGNSSQPLYGAYHSPRCSTFRDSAVLLCYPIAQEYLRSHWMLRRVAEQLANAGFHVLRFDYYGTGDSAGDFCDASVDRWQEDIRLAGEELLNMSGASSLSVIGLRFGATLAALTPGLSIKKLVLWDPVIDGDHYIDQLRHIHDQRLVNRHRYPSLRVEGIDYDSREIIGFWFSDLLEKNIRRISLFDHSCSKVNDVAIMSSVESDECVSLREHLSSAGINARYEWVGESSEWSNVEGISSALLGRQMSNEIVKWLAQNG